MKLANQWFRNKYVLVILFAIPNLFLSLGMFSVFTKLSDISGMFLQHQLSMSIDLRVNWQIRTQINRARANCYVGATEANPAITEKCLTDFEAIGSLLSSKGIRNRFPDDSLWKRIETYTDVAEKINLPTLTEQEKLATARQLNREAAALEEMLARVESEQWMGIVDKSNKLSAMLGQSYRFLIACVIFFIFLFAIGAFLIFLNLEDLRSLHLSRSEIEFQRQKLQNSAKLSALGEMACNVAHEINTPLTVLKGYAFKLDQNVDKKMLEPEELKKIASKMNSMVDRISRIVTSLRNFARDGSKDSFVVYSLTQILCESLALCQERFKNSGVEVRLQKDFNGLSVACRPTEISQVFLNILSNAYSAIDGKTGDKWIEINAEKKEKLVVVTFTDCGLGIPAHVRAKIFEPFFSTKPMGAGTGLGMSISSEIIRSHFGRMYVDETCPNTRFVIELPLPT